MSFYTSSSLLLTTVVALAGCSSDPLEPGAGSDPGTGTNSLLVTGRAAASPRFANATAAADFTTELAISISLGGTRITTGTVTVQSRTGSVDLAWHDNGGQLGQWEGTLPGYDEVYRLDVTAGADTVHGVVVDGPDIAVITAPTAGATLDSKVANMMTWSREDAADIASFRADEIDRTTIADTGTFSIAPGSFKADKDAARTNTIELRRANHVAPAGAVAGSDFIVQVEQQLEVIAQPAPQ